jgi:hypothetical protein
MEKVSSTLFFFLKLFLFSLPAELLFCSENMTN